MCTDENCKAYRPDPSASTIDLKISPNYKNATYAAQRSFRARANRIRVTNSNTILVANQCLHHFRSTLVKTRILGG
ncbi:hypothetical protein PanWU01x14_168700, partial [Parasponia andersonii]